MMAADTWLLASRQRLRWKAAVSAHSSRQQIGGMTGRNVGPPQRTAALRLVADRRNSRAQAASTLPRSEHASCFYRAHCILLPIYSVIMIIMR